MLHLDYKKRDAYLRDMMIRFLCLSGLLVFIFCGAKAQYRKVEVGIDGFTCSMCGMSVENSIRRLPFVREVQMDLNKSTAVIFFRKDQEVSIQKIADEVYSSGFSVRSIQAEYDFPTISVQDYVSYSAGKEEFHFVSTAETTLNGVVTIIFLNKRLISRKEYSHWEEWIKKDVKKNGKKDHVYYVTLVHG